MGASEPAFRHRERVRWVDTDASGHIHFTALLRWFEWAEQELFRSLGLSIADLVAENVNIPRVHVEADYQAPLRYDDRVEVEVFVERVGGASATLGFSVRREDGVPAGKGRITFCAVDLETGRSRPLPDRLRAALERARARAKDPERR